MSSEDIIYKNYTWSEITDPEYLWIRNGDNKYKYLRQELIDWIYPILKSSDKNLLLDGLIRLINFIKLKYFQENSDLFWQQLIQNNRLDLRALLNLMLPFINDNENDDNKKKLRSLSDIYLAKNSRGQYIYTNSQYNRCVRYMTDNDKIAIVERPFDAEYFYQHLELLLSSIESSANKLYVNWVDILPMAMVDYQMTTLYRNTVEKITSENRQANLINNYIDLSPGLSYQDIYNVMANHLYYEIRNYRWLIYDINIDNKPVTYLSYLENRFDLQSVWDGMLWAQLTPSAQNTFSTQWRNFFDSNNLNDRTILHHFYFYFSKYHRSSQKLIAEGKLKLTMDIGEEEDDTEDNAKITPETTRNARIGLANVPIEEIYTFLHDQFSAFKRSWFYYVIKIKKQTYLSEGNDNQRIFITPKNIYNYSKSMAHFIYNNKFTPLPRHWNTLRIPQINIILIRLLDIIDAEQNDWSKNNWFNINNYFRRFYSFIGEADLPAANQAMHRQIRTKLVDIIFESLIYHGLLSDFRPAASISDNSVVIRNAGNNDKAIKNYMRTKMRELYFNGANRGKYESTYYYLTGESYNKLSVNYFDFLTKTEQGWTFTYAMNWISQINLFHHYANNRVIYVTAPTGRGKSTQMPKLFLYAQKMLDYNANGKIICTQPRIEPTVTNARTISRELGVPIVRTDETHNRDIATNQYYVQYQYAEKSHVDKYAKSFLRIVTDGTLFEEMIQSPFLTRSSQDPAAIDEEGRHIDWPKIYSANNIYDIIMVDEAHEHNTNMDMILTLARDTVYVNNSLKLVIISATMEDDEPIYRRYYRTINDNRAYPLSAYIEANTLDRANMDRRIDIGEPGATTIHPIIDHWLPKAEADLINEKNLVDAGIQMTLKIINTTTTGDILVFMTGRKDIVETVTELNAKTPANVISFGYYSDLTDLQKEFIRDIHINLPKYTRYKEDTNLDEKDVTRRVPAGTYTRAIIVATNVAEASITLARLRYVVDTGYSKVEVYDPIKDKSERITMPISWTSSQQRRGRVGRVQPGEVFYLYNKEKIINNKTAYKIADSNIMDILIKLLKSNAKDSPIITSDNDINYIRNLEKIYDIAISGEFDRNGLIYQILKNPRPYIDIIRRYYLFLPDLTDIYQYYIYIGKINLNHNENTIKINPRQYFLDNHDDYHFQRRIEFESRSHTGYDDYKLKDDALEFYIIHPDENVIKRNPYTGKMIDLKLSRSITPEYYYNLLMINNIFDPKVDIQKINFDEFELLKYNLFMENAKLQLMAIDMPRQDSTINYTDINDAIIRYYIKTFFDEINLANQLRGDFTTIKSPFFINLQEIRSLNKSDILNNMNDLLWYSYAIPYGIENDVLAIELLSQIVPDVSQWIDQILSGKDIRKFFSMHLTKEGDIYFLRMLWQQIKKIFIQHNIITDPKWGAITSIELENTFRNLKTRYTAKQTISYESYEILNKMYYSGQLNSKDEFYYFMREYEIDFSNKLNQNTKDMLTLLAKSHNIKPNHLLQFAILYLAAIFEMGKGQWLKKYKLEHGLLEEDENKIDIIEWAKNKLALPSIFENPTEWDRILEAYIRAFSTNVVKVEKNTYLKINSGVRFDPSFWSPKLILEKTFLENKNLFMIYHNTDIGGEIIQYQTPILLEWVFKLNPMYYYFLIFEKKNLLNRIHDIDRDAAIKILQHNKHLFNLGLLYQYLDMLLDPNVSSQIRKRININMQ